MRIVALVALSLLGCGDIADQGLVEKSQRDEIARMSSEEPAMAKAFQRASGTLDGFLRIAQSPPPNTASFAVKIALSDKKETEYFWISPFSWTGDSFKGTLGNTPRLVRHVKEGQELQFKRADIVDWMYVDNGTRRMHGNFTACALLTKEKPEEAARFQKHYGLECDL
jgi:uncharacterized protein YegJ (DUF2314 family)